MKQSTKENCIFGILFVLVIAGQSLAFDDDVAQHSVNCDSATYVNDNNLECL